jgi:hypothetical protein
VGFGSPFYYFETILYTISHNKIEPLMITSNDEPVWTSKTNPIAAILPMFYLSMSLCIGLISHFDTDFLSEKYLPLDNGIVLISLLLLITALVYLIYVYLMPVYTLYEDRIVKQSKRAPEETFYLRDMGSWQYSEGTSRGGSIFTDHLSLYFSGQKIGFANLFISNLNELRDWLIKNHPNPEAKIKKNMLVGFLSGIAVFISIMVPMFLIISFQNGLNKNKGSDTVHLGRLVLSDSPRFIAHSHKGSATTYEMRLKTQELKDFELAIRNIGHMGDKVTVEQSLHKNDTIYVTILQYDYDIKITKTKEPSFGDKHFGWRSILIKHIRAAGIYF